MMLYMSKQIIELNKLNKYRFIVICSSNDTLRKFCNDNKIKYYPIEMHRRFSFLSDISCFFSLLYIYYKEKIDISHSWTSKAGFLNAIASFIFFTKKRIHTYTGIPWENLSLLKKFFPFIADLITSKLSNLVFADSNSQADYLNKKFFSNKIKVLGSGSISGIDFNKFQNSTSYPVDNWFIKFKYKILFVGRITAEKGVDDLIEGFINYGLPDCGLVVMGYIDNVNGNIKHKNIEELKFNKRIKWIEFNDNPEYYYNQTNLLILPSYREGFGNVVIEAAGLKVATVGYNSTGLKDSIINNKTGVLVEKGNVKNLYKTINDLLLNKKYLKYSENAYLNARKNYSITRITQLVDQLYES